MGAQPVRRRQPGADGELPRECEPSRILFDPNLLKFSTRCLALRCWSTGGRVLWLNLEAARLWKAASDPDGLAR